MATEARQLTPFLRNECLLNVLSFPAVPVAEVRRLNARCAHVKRNAAEAPRRAGPSPLGTAEKEVGRPPGAYARAGLIPNANIPREALYAMSENPPLFFREIGKGCGDGARRAPGLRGNRGLPRPKSAHSGGPLTKAARRCHEG